MRDDTAAARCWLSPEVCVSQALPGHGGVNLLMLKTLVGTCVPLFLALPIGCDFHIKGDTDPTYKEMEMCAKIGADWLSRIGTADTEDWYYIKECSIGFDDPEPEKVHIHVVSSLDRVGIDECSAQLEALESAVRSVMNSPVSVRLEVSNSESTCARADVSLRSRDTH